MQAAIDRPAVGDKVSTATGGKATITSIHGDVITTGTGLDWNWDSDREWLVSIASDNGYEQTATKPETKPKRRQVATYNYTDESGKLIYQKIRYENPKTFEQRRPSGEGWVYSLKKISSRPLYNLPTVNDADEVIVVEGEKDADRLNELGKVATTAGGAGVWREEHSKALAGKNVCLFQDNDEAGIKSAHKIAGKLIGKAAHVKIVELPGVGPGGDVSDWLDAGGTIEQLQELYEAAPVYNAPEALEAPTGDGGRQRRAEIREHEKSGASGQSAMIPQTGQKWGMAALRDAAQVIRAAQEGSRNNTLRDQAPGIYELINGGELDRITTEQTLTLAALAAGLEEKEIAATLKSAADYVGNKARSALEQSAAFSANGQKPAGQVGDIAIPKPISGAEFAARKFEPLQFLIALLIAKGHFVLLAGRPKGGKSWLALTMAMCVDLGLSFLGKTTKAARVLYIALEDGQRRMNARMAALKWLPRRADFLFNIAQFDGPGGTLGPGLQQLAELAKAYDLIVIDTLIRTLSGRVDENNNTQMGAIANEIASIAHATNTAIIVIHHTGKGQADDRFEKLRGASSIRGAYDVGLILERQQGEREAVLGAESRDLEIEDMTLRQVANGAGWEYLGPGFQIESIRAGRKTLEAMLTHPTYLDGLTAADIAEVRGVGERAAQQQLLSLELGGYVVRESPKSTAMGRRPDIWHVSDEYKG